MTQKKQYFKEISHSKLPSFAPTKLKTFSALDSFHNEVICLWDIKLFIELGMWKESHIYESMYYS